MPWRLEENHSSCPASRSWAVVKIDDGEVEGCHRSRAAAQRQLAALNAAEEGRGDMTEKELRTLDIPLREARAEVRNGRTLVGYAAVFNRPVEIDSLRGRFTETVAPGAFAKTLRERRDQVQVLFNHGQDPYFGTLPIGRPDVIREDDRGLYVEVPLFESPRNDEIVNAIGSGAIRGMSVQFMAQKDEWSRDRSERTIKEAAVYEFGPVTFPAQPAAVAEVRCDKCSKEIQAGSSDEASRDSTHDRSRVAGARSDRTTSEVSRGSTCPEDRITRVNVLETEPHYETWRNNGQ